MNRGASLISTWVGSTSDVASGVARWLVTRGQSSRILNTRRRRRPSGGCKLCGIELLSVRAELRYTPRTMPCDELMLLRKNATRVREDLLEQKAKMRKF